MNPIPRRADDAHVVTLANAVRVVVMPLPHLETASVSVFVRTGSSHESRRQNGISHVVEHMAFKGTRTRTCQQINLQAERLGADVNAHTDKDHTAYHMRGRARDAAAFVRMLGDIVQASTFPEAELDRERQVLLQEFIEDEEEPISTAYKLFDKLCFGSHPLAQPVIGSRANIRRLDRDELLAYVQQQYSGANVVVGIAGHVDVDAVVRDAEATFRSMRAGLPNLVDAPAQGGGIASRALTGSAQTHLVFGLPLPTLLDEAHHAGVVAAALFGEGMSSPLLDEIRERRGLAYYLSCSADIGELAGQFVVEASTAPEHADEFLAELKRLLEAQAGHVDPVGLERAKNQIAVRRLRAWERPARRLEDAALDLLALGRVRSRDEMAERIEAVDAAQVRDAFTQMLLRPEAIAIAGRIRKGSVERAREIFALR
ncbi:MAG TPA: pitrilysin family protein [Caldimonas sp.]|nr:pitrilysin family protein [Caldimonas sp.]